MNKLTLLLSWRFLKGTKKEPTITTMFLISFFGICIGAFSLALIASVMNGFEHVTYKTIRGAHSHITMHTHNNDPLNVATIKKIIKKEFPEIKSIHAYTTKQVVITKQDSYETIILKGVNFLNNKNHQLNMKIKSDDQTASFFELLQQNEIMIGSKLAQNFDLEVNDSITLLFAPEDEITSKKIKLEQKDAFINGIFTMGIEEFDASMAFCSLSFLKSLFEDAQLTHLSLMLHDEKKSEEVIAQLEKRFNMHVYSWKDLYPAIISSLKLEKYAMFLLLSLITLVASTNIMSLIFMYITKKRKDIAILKVMGMTNKMISHIFLSIGMIISFVSTVSGLLFAIIAAYILDNYPFITLPDAYYASYLPVKMTSEILIITFVVVLLLSFIATWLSVKNTKNINISNVLRFER